MDSVFVTCRPGSAECRSMDVIMQTCNPKQKVQYTHQLSSCCDSDKDGLCMPELVRNDTSSGLDIDGMTGRANGRVTRTPP